MSPHDLSYYRERIETERALAHTSASPEIADIHRQLADLYERLFDINVQTSDTETATFGAAAA